MSLLASRRVVLGLVGGSAAALLALPAAAADPAAQLIEKTATEVIQIIKTTTPGPARQAGPNHRVNVLGDKTYTAVAKQGVAAPRMLGVHLVDIAVWVVGRMCHGSTMLMVLFLVAFFLVFVVVFMEGIRAAVHIDLGCRWFAMRLGKVSCRAGD